MQTFTSRSGLREHLGKITKSGGTVGFVPTMGALHAGHLSLLQRSVDENDVTVISIFVNPTQFNNAEDLKKYPRTLDADLAKIETISEAIVVFAPDVAEMYGSTTVSRHFDFGGIENEMEGKFRPGHFDGVGTIVSQLLEIVEPRRAYFGEKDYQQLQIVRKLVEICKIPVEIIECPIFREENGLAMSSRNERLSPEMRAESGFIYQVLRAARERFGMETADGLRAFAASEFRGKEAFGLEYFEVADAQTLEPAKQYLPGRNYRAFIAVHLDGVRLIDTILLN